MTTKKTAAVNTLASQLHLLAKGDKPFPPKAQSSLLEVTVDQHSHLPSMFTLRLTDTELELLDGDIFQLGTYVKITADNHEGEPVTLIEGEVTALEPAFEPGMIGELLVRGYDQSHRLYRENKSRTFVNQKDSDLATTIAEEHNLTPKVMATATVYEHIYQHNQSDLAFLQERAWRIGYECFVMGGTLVFRPPLEQEKQPVALRWGDDLQSFHPRLTTAEQVEEVQVRGWDAANLKPIVGKANVKDGKLYPSVAEKETAVQWATTFEKSSKLIIADQPVVSQAEADLLAQARLNELSGALITADGEAFRRPEVQAGHIVNLQGLGKRLSGHYLVTSTTHFYGPSGLTTSFSVQGARTGTMAEQVGAKRPFSRWPGLVPAIVTNTDDPNDWGRVKVKFSWLSDTESSHWARVMGIGAGPDAGFFGLPEVDDEVLVGFLHGDFNQPTVLGGVWNGRHQIPPTVAAARNGEKPLVRTWHSRSGHQISLHDTSDNKLEIQTPAGLLLLLDDKQQRIEIKSKSGVTILLDDKSKNIEITADSEISISSGANMSIEAGGNLTMNARGNMDLSATGQVNVKGAMINLN